MICKNIKIKVKSRFAEYFNHDDCASTYDVEVQDETNPIRAGYCETLAWVALKADISPKNIVLDLGCGTGNTSALLGRAAQLVCVDISANMIEIAKRKLAAFENIVFIQSDLLEFFESNERQFDKVVSAYAVHHLTENEKPVLFREIRKYLAPGGRAIFGDLMFQNNTEKRNVVNSLLQRGYEEAAADIEDEFFWDLDDSLKQLRSLDFRTEVERFSELSWGVAAYLG